MTAKRYTDEAQLPVYEALKSMPKIIDKPAHTAIIKRKYRTTATLRHTGTGVNAVGGRLDKRGEEDVPTSSSPVPYAAHSAQT